MNYNANHHAVIRSAF